MECVICGRNMKDGLDLHLVYGEEIETSPYTNVSFGLGTSYTRKGYVTQYSNFKPFHLWVCKKCWQHQKMTRFWLPDPQTGFAWAFLGLIAFVVSLFLVFTQNTSDQYTCPGVSLVILLAGVLYFIFAYSTLKKRKDHPINYEKSNNLEFQATPKELISIFGNTIPILVDRKVNEEAYKKWLEEEGKQYGDESRQRWEESKLNNLSWWTFDEWDRWVHPEQYKERIKLHTVHVSETPQDFR